MKLTYWVAGNLTNPVFNIRAKTRREVKALLEGYYDQDYGPPEKVVVNYDSAFELVERCLGEGGDYKGEIC